ncbi:MAG: MFS transporter, partial [Dehalococcoidia bacterium]
IPSLLPRRLMSNGIALHSMARNLDQVLAPSIAGVLLAIDPALTFLAIVVMHLFSTVFSMRLPKGAPAQGKGRGMFGEVKFGLRYIAGAPVLRTLVGLAFVAVILGYPFQQLLPVFQDVLLISEWQFGLMYSAVGLGALVGSLLLATFARLATRGYPQLLTGVMFGVMLAAFALSPVYALSLFLLFFLGMASQSYNTMNQTLMMTHSDPALYGRVASVNMMTRSFMPLSVLPMGALVDAFGAPTTLAVSGTLLVLVVLLIGAAVPSLWRERAPT